MGSQRNGVRFQMNGVRAGLICAVVLLAAGREASAQVAAPPPATGRVAGLSAGVSFGKTVEYCCPDDPITRVTGSLRVPLGSSVSVEGGNSPVLTDHFRGLVDRGRCPLLGDV